MNILRNFLFLTIPQFFKNNEVRREVCKIASVCGGGSGGGVLSVNTQTGDVVLDATDVGALPDTYVPPDQTLQQVTTAGNITNNAVQVTGAGNLSFTDSVALVYNAGTTQLVSISGSEITLVTLSSANWAIGNNNNVVLMANAANTTPFRFTNNSVLERVSGADATQPNDFVTLQQMRFDIATTTNVVTQATTLNLNPSIAYTFDGAVAPTFTLPAVIGTEGKRVGVINDSAVTITLNSNAGGNDIFSNGTKASTITIGSGETNIFLNNTKNWVAVA